MRLVAPCALVGPLARRAAKRMPFSASSSSPTTRLTTFQRSSVGASYRPPVITNSRARAGPARSAIRCVPPIAGVRPTTRSTSPKRAPSAASRMSQPSDSSRPAVRHSPCTDAIVGNGNDSSLWTIATRSRNSAAAWSGVLSSNTWTSTPPVKTSPSARTTSARSISPSSSSSPWMRSLIIRSSNRLSGGEFSARIPTSPSRSSLTVLATQLLRDLLDLVRVALLGAHRQLQRVVLVARDHVDVEVEDRLPGGALGRVEQVDAVRLEAVAGADGQTLGRGHHLAERLVVDLVQVLVVLARNDQRVTPGPRVDVHERDRVLVLVDDRRGRVTRDDRAENAVVWHRGSVPTPGLSWRLAGARAWPRLAGGRLRVRRRAALRQQPA